MQDTAPETNTTRRGAGLLRPLEYVFGPWTRENGMTWLRLILLVLAIKWLLIDPYRVPSGSMEPTLQGNMNYLRDDRVVVNKLAYGIRLPMTSLLLWPISEPRRFDVVVFRSVEPPSPHASPLMRLVYKVWPTTLIKRVIGLPGERVHIQDGVVYINGKPLALPQGMPPVHYTSLAPDDPVTYVVGKDPDGNLDMVARGTRMRYGVWDEDKYSVVPKDCYLMLGDNSDNSVDGRYFGWVPRNRLVGRAYGIWWPIGRARDLSGFTQTWWGLALLIGIPLLCVLGEWIFLFVAQSWRVRENVPELDLRRNERLRVNCLAPGLRVPFSRMRVTRGDALRPGELVLYLAPKGTECAGAPLLGRIAESSDEGYVIDSAEGPEYPDSRRFGPVGRGDIVGRAESRWWPLGRRRALAPGTGGEDRAKATYGKED
jgi:signal peptidase I